MKENRRRRRNGQEQESRKKTVKTRNGTEKEQARRSRRKVKEKEKERNVKDKYHATKRMNKTSGDYGNKKQTRVTGNTKNGKGRYGKEVNIRRQEETEKA